MAGTTRQGEKGRGRGASVGRERYCETSSIDRGKPLGEHTENLIIACPRSNTKITNFAFQKLKHNLIMSFSRRFQILLFSDRLVQLVQRQITVWKVGVH